MSDLDEKTITLTYREYAVFLEKTTLRDQFAMAALTGMLATNYATDRVAKYAYQVADAMLEARKEKK